MPGTPANTGAPTEPYPGVTPDFTYVQPNPAEYAPFGGEYTVQNIMNNSMSATIGAWWRIADHTAGNETGRMMIVNGYNPGAVFFRTTVFVQPDTNYLFTAWILNLFRVTGYPDPRLVVRITGQNGEVLYDQTLGTLIPPNTNAPEWRQIGTVLNAQNNTSLTVEFLSEGPEVIGNDYAIDDISFNEIQVPEFIPVKTVDRQSVNVGETAQYTVTLTNSCINPLTGLFFRDPVPTGLFFVSGSVTINGAPSPSADPGTGFTLPDVLGGQTVTVTFMVRADEVPEPNPIYNRAFVDYSYTPVEGGIPGDFSVVSNEVPLQVGFLADVSIEKTAAPTSVLPGETVLYTLSVYNAGPSSAQNTVVTDVLPAGLGSAEISADGGATWQPYVNTVTVGDLMPGAVRSYLIRATVTDSTAGTLVNTAVVTSDTPDPDPDNNTSSAAIQVQPPGPEGADVSIEKTASPNPAVRCQYLVYTLNVSNAGPEAAENVVVSDQLPPEFCKPAYSLDAGETWTEWTGSVHIGTLAAGASVAVLVAGIVRSCAKCCIRNTARVSAASYDPNPYNNTANLTVRVCR